MLYTAVTDNIFWSHKIENSKGSAKYINWDFLILINLYISHSYVGDGSHSEEEDTQHLQMKQRKHRNTQEQEKMFLQCSQEKNGFSFSKG